LKFEQVGCYYVVAVDITVTLNNASDYRANGLLSDHIGWTE